MNVKAVWWPGIILLGKSRPYYSNKYGLVYCMAGIWAGTAQWVRVYPVAFEVGRPLQKFDVIEVGVRDPHPESHRPETLKAYPKCVRKVWAIERVDDQLDILKNNTETGSFLHGEEWRTRSLGMINPLNPEFSIAEWPPVIEGEGESVEVCYRCNHPYCFGHKGKVFDADLQANNKEDLRKLRKTLQWLERQELRFVMGTLAYHPHRWMVIGVHSFRNIDEKILVEMVKEYRESRKRETEALAG